MSGQHIPTAPFNGPTPLEALLKRAAREPDRVALIAEGERWTSSRLAEGSARLASGFHARGVEAGDRVALHMTNRVELALGFLACWRIGAIAVPLNTRHKTPELIAMIERVQPTLYLGGADLYEGVRPIPENVLPRGDRFVVGLDDSEASRSAWTELMEAEPDHGRLETRDALSDRDAPAMLLSTSGTTGPSKLAIWTHRTLASFLSSAEGRGVGPNDTLALAAPMAHASGAVCLTSCLLTGAVAVLLARFDADAVLDAIAGHHCTTLLGLPFMYAALARQQKSQPRDLSSIRQAASGGDVCQTETERAFAEAFPCRLLSLWAATEEAGAGMPASGSGPLTRFLPDAEVRFIGEGGESVAAGQAGEMLIRSHSTTPGYWLGPDRTDPLPDGWFHSGDMIRQEPDGQFRYMGRRKDLIVRGGSNISPTEVEEALRHQSGVADAAVAGLLDPELGQRVGAALVLTVDATDAAVAGIIAGVRRELADYKVPERVVVSEAIPRNALAKVDRKAVGEIIETGGKAV